MERREAVARPDAVGDDGRQDGAPAPGRHLDVVAPGDAERPGVVRVDLHERAGVELVELGDPAGLGHGVPLVLQAAGVQHDRVVVVRQLGGRQVRPREELRPAARGREEQPGAGAVGPLGQGLADPVVEVADRVAVRPVGGGARPLHRGVAQPLVRHAAQVVAGLRVPGPLDLLEDLLGAAVAEGLFEAHLAGDPGDDLPVRQRLADGVGGRPGEGEVALGVDHDALGLHPHRGGQHHVGVRVGLGVGEDVLGDHQLGPLQARDDRPAVGDRGDRVGADDPARLDVAGGHLLEHLDGAPADVGPQAAGCQPPQVLGEPAVLRDEHRALAGQAGAHVAHLAAAHRVGLTGQ